MKWIILRKAKGSRGADPWLARKFVNLQDELLLAPVGLKRQGVEGSSGAVRAYLEVALWSGLRPAALLDGRPQQVGQDRLHEETYLGVADDHQRQRAIGAAENNPPVFPSRLAEASPVAEQSEDRGDPINATPADFCLSLGALALARLSREFGGVLRLGSERR